MATFWRTDPVQSLLTNTVMMALTCVAAALCRADEPAGTRQPQRSQTRAASAEPVSGSAEKAALEFARAQHPELADLLDALRRSNRPAYQAALRDVSRDAERLAKLAERDGERYELSLRIWNLDSRVRLEIARLSMSSDIEVESRLRPMIEERQAARLALLDLEYQRQKDRFEKVSEQLDATRRSSVDRVSAEIDRIQRLIASRSKTRNANSNTKSNRAGSSDQSNVDKRVRAGSGSARSSSGGRKQPGQ
jgi:hypothetical protein